MKEFVINFDIYSNEAKLTLEQGRTRFSNAFGGFLGLISLTAISALSLYFLTQFFIRENSSVVINEEAATELNILLNEVPLMIRLSDSNSKRYDNAERIYKIELKLWMGGANETNTIELPSQWSNNVIMETCDINKHFGEYKQLFESFTDIESFYCPVLRMGNQTIYGVYGDLQPFSYYHFYIAMCVNSTAIGNSCYDQTTINKYLSSTYLDFRTVDYSIISLNAKPNEMYVRNDRHVLSNTVYKRIWMYMKTVHYFTDVGFVMEDRQLEDFYKVDSFRYDTDLRDIWIGTIPGTFANLSILNLSQKISYYRSYMKLQTFLANVGGIINGIMVIAYWLNYLISERLYYLYLINNTMEDTPDLNREVSEIKIINLSQMNANKMIAPSLKNDINNNACKPSDSNLTFSWYHYILPMCWINKRKRDVYLSKLSQLNEKLCLVNIIKLLTEFERVKEMLFQYNRDICQKNKTTEENKKFPEFKSENSKKNERLGNNRIYIKNCNGT